MGNSSVPQYVLQNRAKLDKTLYPTEGIEIDIDPNVETDDFDELIEEFGDERVGLAYYYLHRHRLYKMKIISRLDLDTSDVVAFMLIEEEQGLRQAQESLKLRQSAEKP